ncbi:methionyl-tRNA formyltransferase [Patescibacteria group bacterium]|nr:methionyl-tRNA formyltransferase [Patescibacteria group bacterium]
MKILFFGTPDIAAKILAVLSQIPQIKIMGVVTQPDKKTGRKQILSPPPVKEIANQLAHKVYQPKTKAELKKLAENFKDADFFLVIAYGNILPKEVLETPKHGCINLHASLLPKYRGASPIQETLLNGDKETGITIMKMDRKMDEGDIYLIRRIEIKENDNLESLTNTMASLGANILPLCLNDIAEGNLSAIPQDHSRATYCRKVEKKDGEIQFERQEAIQIMNMQRAYTPWPSVFFRIKGKTIRILEMEESQEKLKPGEFKTDKARLEVGTKKGSLNLKTLQMEGKKPAEIKEFLNGYKNLFE